ncbi:exopolysaccharide biosynthesis protein [Halomonas sp. HK25]|uniref:exopolysaccharide biosynthesis protein n=1 Tax=Halomonas sp. HK25 TaxID=3394321 RepID=UPI0039FBA16B
MSATPHESDPHDEASAPRSLEELLAAIEAIEAPSGKVHFEEILEAVGWRSFGPLLLLAGVVTLMPVISGIPGVPLLMACFTLLVCAQLLMRRRTFWLPAWLRRRWISRSALHKGLGYLHRPARGVDRLFHRRLAVLTGPRGVQASALACLLVAMSMPPMELIPFSANVAGLTLSLFGLALMVRDGLLALIAFMLAGSSLTLVGTALL